MHVSKHHSAKYEDIKRRRQRAKEEEKKDGSTEEWKHVSLSTAGHGRRRSGRHLLYGERHSEGDDAEAVTGAWLHATVHNIAPTKLRKG